MNDLTPRLRMFAGPNGSGKSTIESIVGSELIGIYINPDEIEKKIQTCGFLDLADFKIQTKEKEILNFFQKSFLLQEVKLLDESKSISCIDNKISFERAHINSYFASVIADFIRHKLLEDRRSFTFETVMSAADKIQFLKRAQQKGYRTYLYYIATEDPSINASRVQHRVKMGGHAVPEDKIFSRYKRSVALLKDAISFTNRAYIFDNSGSQQIWLAEITDGKVLELKTESIPIWFKNAVWNKFKEN